MLSRVWGRFVDVSLGYAEAHLQNVLPSAESGCLFYAVTLDDASTGRLVVTERWQDQASLTAHLEGPQTAAFQKWAKRIKIDVLRYDVSDGRQLTD